MRHLFVFIGPYAAWCFPYEDWAAKIPTPEGWPAKVPTPSMGPLMDEVLNSEVFAWAGVERMIERDGVWHQRYFAVPQGTRPGGPDRPMLFRTDPMTYGFLTPIIDPTDWAGLDRDAELRWFRLAFCAEIARASELFGTEPEFHWGLVIEQG